MSNADWASDSTLVVESANTAEPKWTLQWTEAGETRQASLRPAVPDDDRCSALLDGDLCVRPQGHDGLHVPVQGNMPLITS